MTEAFDDAVDFGILGDGGMVTATLQFVDVETKVEVDT